MKNVKLLILIFVVLVSGRSHAQAQFENFIKSGTDDANVLLNHYMSPILKGVGYGFNSGWYNTAKPHETLGFDFSLAFNATYIPVADQSFEFDPTEYNITRIKSGQSTLPTIMGNNSSTTLENYISDPNLPPPGEISLGTFNAPNGIADNIQSVVKKVFFPTPIIQAGIGAIKGSEIKIRWMPSINTKSFSFKYFGVGGLHSISQWIPVLKNLPVDISAFVGYTKIDAEYPIPAGGIVGENQLSSFGINTLTYQIIASAHVSVITGYVGLGMDNFKTTFKMLGTYDTYPNEPLVPILVDPISLEQQGTGGFRTTVGARVKLAILTLHADYTIREYKTLTAGLGFTFR